MKLAEITEEIIMQIGGPITLSNLAVAVAKERNMGVQYTDMDTALKMLEQQGKVFLQSIEGAESFSEYKWEAVRGWMPMNPRMRPGTAVTFEGIKKELADRLWLGYDK